MVTHILGKKLGMTRIFDNAGKAWSVTVIEAGPCTVLDIRTQEKNGYTALQVGFDKKLKKACTKPEMGLFKKVKTDPKRFIREIPWDGQEEVKIGDEITLEKLGEIKKIDLTGITKGRGFMGVVRRWGFHGLPATHGQSDRERAPGSLGRQHSISQGVYPGKRMAGHWGIEQVTHKNVRVVQVDGAKNLLFVNGAVPGPTGAYVTIRKSPQRAKSKIQWVLPLPKKGGK